MKIICSDFDGTLNHGGITEKKLYSIRKWQERGNLSCNGALITDKNGNVISDVRCDGEIALPLIEYIFSLDGFFVNICRENVVRIENYEYRIFKSFKSN